MRILSLILLLITAMLSGNCHKESVPGISEQERTGLGNDTMIQPVVSGRDSNAYSYLALGDSYTIGQSVSAKFNFPHQTVSILKKRGWHVYEPNIIAVTGWTTDNLEASIQASPPATDYDLVSLLIGVNDQYGGYSLDHYRAGFEQLLKEAIIYAKGKAGHVVVMSIPDWGVTPFATGRDRGAIAAEIDAFNAVNYEISLQYHVRYLNITQDTRQMGNNPSLVASDGLHPSGEEYLVWAEKLAIVADSIFNQKGP